MSELKMSKSRDILLRIALLCCTIIVSSTAAINGNISEIVKAFPDVSLSTVELISTMPSLFLMISVLTSRNIAKAIGYKKTVLIGIGIDVICGSIPMVVSNIYVILISRALFGFGVGMFNSLMVALICYFYDGNERSTMIGLQGTIGGLGGLMITFLSGQLLKISWQASFAAYLVAIPIFFMFFIFVPKVSTEEILANNEALKKKADEVKLEVGKESYLPVIGFVLLIFVANTLYMTMGIKESSLITTMGYVTASDGSKVIMLLCVGSMISGLSYGRYIKFTKKFTIPMGFMIMGCAIILMGASNSVVLTAFGGFLSGFAAQFILPYMMEMVNKDSAKRGGVATSLLIVSANLGSFLSPYGSKVIERISWIKDLRGLFYTDGTILLVLAAAGIVVAASSTVKDRNLGQFGLKVDIADLGDIE